MARLEKMVAELTSFVKSQATHSQKTRPKEADRKRSTAARKKAPNRLVPGAIITKSQLTSNTNVEKARLMRRIQELVSLLEQPQDRKQNYLDALRLL